MGWYVILGSLPIVVLGVLLKDVIENDFRSLYVIGTTLIVMGIVLGIADRVGGTERRLDGMTLKHAVLYGAAQALALVPGVSRSGATISMGRFLGYDREAATRFAFLLAIPAVIGAGVFELLDVIQCEPGSEDCANAYAGGPTLVATLVSFVVGYSVIAWLLRYVTTRSYTPFVVYRIVLGVLTLALAAGGVLTTGG
jgi:undecaprenyl-diphosphatase